MPFTALLIRIHHPITLVSLQRRGFINYIERYKYAYITKSLGYRKQRSGLDAIYSFIDSSTSPYHLGIAYKEGDLKTIKSFINLLISPKVLGITNKEAGWTPFTALLICLHQRITLVSLQRGGFINYLELYKSAYITKILGYH